LLLHTGTLKKFIRPNPLKPFHDPVTP